MNEALSALLDGECSPSELDRLLADFDRDPRLRREFARMCVAREARMGTRVRQPDLDFADRVRAALHTEQPPATAAKRPSAVVVALGDRIRRMPWRMATSLAAAAAIGAVSVLAVRPAAMPEAAPVVVQSATAVAEAEPVETGYADLDDENARQLRNYLMAYSQSGGHNGVGSTLGYARYAAYTDDRPATARPADLKR